MWACSATTSSAPPPTDRTTSTNQKVAALQSYFAEAPPADAAWALARLGPAPVTPGQEEEEETVDDPFTDADNGRGWMAQQVTVFGRFLRALAPRFMRGPIQPGLRPPAE